MFLLATIIILSYLIGSIPTGIIVSKAARGIDIREHGSGNAGGTNVMRVLGWKHGLFVILLDAFKGVLAVIVVARLHYGSMPFQNVTPFDDFTLVQIIAGISAVIGHVWTIFAGFKGGKGIATALGMLINDYYCRYADRCWCIYYCCNYIKICFPRLIIGAIAVPLSLIIRENVFNVDIPGYNTILPFIIAISFLIIYTHRKNVVRILNGSENKLSFKKKAND